jgi:hypothetical protein
MFCKICNYALWNLKERTCPECGTGFAPSQFRFKPNAIRFLCPHCSQQYFGTSRTGHLVPDRFDCVNCHQPIAMDQMVLVPAAGVDERKTRARVNPWTDRIGRPKLRDWFKSVGLSLFVPGSLILATDISTPRARTLGFAVLTAAIASAASIIMPFMVTAPFLVPLGINANGIEAIAVYGLGVMISGLLMYAIVPLYALIAHIILLGGKPQHGLRVTMHAASMSSGANLLWGVPIMGLMIGPVGAIWWGVSMSVMLRAVHRVTPVRAYIAGLGPPLVAFGAAIAGFVAFVVWAMTLGVNATAQMGAATAAQIAAVEGAIASNTLSGERHVGSLILDGSLLQSSVIATPFSQTSQIIAGGVDLSQALLTMTDQERATLAATLDASLTPDVIAYRVGDLIVIRDVPIPSPTSALWHVAYCLEPTANPGFAQTTLSMQTSSSAPGAFPFNPGQMLGGPSNASINPTLIEQNRIRANHGLPPLPPLESITAAKPFTTADVATTPENPPDDQTEESPVAPAGGS